MSNKTVTKLKLKKNNNTTTNNSIDIAPETLTPIINTLSSILEPERGSSIPAQTQTQIQSEIEIKNCDGLEYLNTIENNSINLILTDPPYIISRDTGMDKHYNMVKENEANNIKYIKTEAEWEAYKEKENEKEKDKEILNDDKKENYMKYGSIYGKKYCVKTQYGDWDNNFTMDKLKSFIGEYYKKLKTGGTLIIWFDLWKIGELKTIMENCKFKQIRFIEWIKTNPQPLNSNTNYLTNCREIALLGVKGGSPTFNSSYDKGIYEFPLQGGKNRFHPTQKSLPLFESLINKHSNENDIVMDTFLGGGTTALACKKTKRKFKGCEISKEYVDKVNEILLTL
jgi:site-specific DNA-methyltransferase (adenine-specific)